MAGRVDFFFDNFIDSNFFNIKYDDGDRERDVKRDLIRLVGGSSSSSF